MTGERKVTPGRKTITSTVDVKSGGGVDGGMNFLNGEVEIEVSGSEKEPHDVFDLHESIEQAVVDAISDFKASEYEEQRSDGE